MHRLVGIFTIAAMTVFFLIQIEGQNKPRKKVFPGCTILYSPKTLDLSFEEEVCKSFETIEVDQLGIVLWIKKGDDEEAFKLMVRRRDPSIKTFLQRLAALRFLHLLKKDIRNPTVSIHVHDQSDRMLVDCLLTKAMADDARIEIENRRFDGESISDEQAFLRIAAEASVVFHK